MIGFGMYTENCRGTGGIVTAAEPAVNHKLDHVAFGVTPGRHCIQGMGDEPGIARKDHPLTVRKVCEDHHLRISQIEGSFPLTGFDSAVFSGQYVQQSIRWARGPGCPKADTTDCRKAMTRPGMRFLSRPSTMIKHACNGQETPKRSYMRSRMAHTPEI